MNIQLLNQVQKMIIDQANGKGINLSDDFASPDEFKKFVIGMAFKGLTEAGASIQQAYDAVFGEGEYDSLFARVTAAA
jgi:hypothetical protein